MKRFAYLLIVLGAIVAAVLIVALYRPPEKRGESKTSAFDLQDFQPDIVTGRRFAPIINPEAFTVPRVGDALRPNELVLGVVVKGTARAYPINMLTGPQREIINDEVGNQAIAATW